MVPILTQLEPDKRLYGTVYNGICFRSIYKMKKIIIIVFVSCMNVA